MITPAEVKRANCETLKIVEDRLDKVLLGYDGESGLYVIKSVFYPLTKGEIDILLESYKKSGWDIDAYHDDIWFIFSESGT